jgi:hypothetical protein
VICDQEIMRNDVKFLQHIVHGGYMDTYIYIHEKYIFCIQDVYEQRSVLIHDDTYILNHVYGEMMVPTSIHNYISFT